MPHSDNVNTNIEGLVYDSELIVNTSWVRSGAVNMASINHLSLNCCWLDI